MDTLQESLKTMQERYLREMSHLSQEMSARDAARARRETYILLAILVVAAFGSAVGSGRRRVDRAGRCGAEIRLVRAGVPAQAVPVGMPAGG